MDEFFGLLLIIFFLLCTNFICFDYFETDYF